MLAKPTACQVCGRCYIYALYVLYVICLVCTPLLENWGGWEAKRRLAGVSGELSGS